MNKVLSIYKHNKRASVANNRRASVAIIGISSLTTYQTRIIYRYYYIPFFRYFVSCYSNFSVTKKN